jgi:predicted metalloendopeptidase
MKKTLLAASVASTLVLLSACGQQQAEQQTTAQTEAATPATATTTTTKAELGSFGVDLTTRDESVKPGDDFFMYAGGTWYKNYVMPADKTRYGAFTALAERSEKQVKEIIDSLASETNLSADEKMVYDFYQAYMDVDAINAKGMAPIADVIAEINAVSSVKDLTVLFGKSWYDATISPIGSGMGFDRLDPNTYQMSISASGAATGLPDRSYYLTDSERFDDIRSAYVAHMAEIFTLAGIDGGQGKADAILALETKLAEAQWPREKRRNRDLTLNQLDRAQLNTEYPGFDWDTYIAQTGYKVAGQLNISQPQPVKDIIALINGESLDTWKDYMTYHAIRRSANLLSEDFFNANFAFYGTKLRGQAEPRPRWKRAIGQMSGTQSLGFAIGKVYVDRYFPESSKAKMADLVKNLRAALGERLETLDWMGAETRKNAQAKLASFRPKIGYPDEWQGFSGVTISDSDLVGNIRSLRKFFREDSASKELERTDRERWGMTPQTVNAYYNSSFNEIVFPAAILQPPFFDPNADPAVNYGGIGAVIGHEIGHGFDDQGSKSDAEGIQRNWWTEEDRAAFEAKTQMLINQYSAYEPIEGNFVNGQNSLGENIGDVGGLAMAYHAYKLSLNGKEAPIIDGTTGDQRFFLAWAQVWRGKLTEQSMLNQLRAGTHAPSKFRTLAPRNHDAWYEAFDVKPGDALYLAPEERVRIW